MYLLDTNHCSRIIDGDSVVLSRLKANADVLVATCVIVQGELIFMAQQSAQKIANLARVEAFLQGIRIYSIDEETAVLYGNLKATLMRHFGPSERRKRRRTTLTQLGFDDNDLWIAAVALRHEITIVSSDSDYQRMQEAWPLSLESWWVPGVPPANS
jgi:tRNA(fMet)-specific endonuclease VapC